MAQSLKSGCQIARSALRGAGGFKSARLATTPSALRLPSSFSSTRSSTASSFSTTSATMSTQKSFVQAVEERRSHYQLNKEAPISDKQITELAEHAILYVPSAFNSQSTRLVILLNQDHEKLWDFILEVLKPLTPEDKFPKTEEKLAGFKAAYGTVLFYEDPAPVDKLKKDYPIYAHQFGDWSEHANAMHQFAVWTALHAEGFGANLQHYNPIIDQRVAQEWSVPVEWQLRGQMVFGGRSSEPGKKEFEPVQGKRLFVHGAKQ
ncbi:Nitroreductase [Dothidotthia symphoricarpi CBS 119687]|uniref:Nitroreductase n=1 Tax=Dothidotthia symphoricarpi CBS 119687 TaxID=1392245 RepID=A0A6A6A0I5_9PLEO|nr:Nitroreductase [Dothidotthia symphoricarpi CBS 119687]KAF2124208.1 Nitroreductase [Dothidotthia symphoricarpi CBS 119687]